MGRVVAIGMAVACSAVACGADGDERSVQVFAASSLATAFADVEVAFEAERPDVDVELNVAASSTLREQILDGAPADVVALANEQTMTELVELGAVEGTPVAIASNSLTVAVPSGNPGDVRGLADLARPELLVGLCAAGVPCGDLARAVLARAGVDAAIDTDEPNVGALRAKIADGELDVGLVYVTDVGDGIESLPIAKEDNLVAVYPIATLRDASPEAAEFVEFVRSAGGRQILAEHGFGSP